MGSGLIVVQLSQWIVDRVQHDIRCMWTKVCYGLRYAMD